MYGAQEFNDTSDTPDLGESLGHDPPKHAVPPQHGPSGYYAQPDCCPGVMGAGVQSMPMCYGNPYMGSAPGGMGYSAAPWCQTLPAWGSAACPGQAAPLVPPQRIPQSKEQKELTKLARDQARYALKLDAAKSLQPGFNFQDILGSDDLGRGVYIMGAEGSCTRAETLAACRAREGKAPAQTGGFPELAKGKGHQVAT